MWRKFKLVVLVESHREIFLFIKINFSANPKIEWDTHNQWEASNFVSDWVTDMAITRKAYASKKQLLALFSERRFVTDRFGRSRALKQYSYWQAVNIISR